MYQTPSQGQGVEAIVQTSSTHSTAQRKPATDTFQPSVIQEHMGTRSIAVEMFKSTSSLHQRLDGTKVDTSLKWFASSPHSFPTLWSRSPCASWAPPLHRGFVRGSFPAPHHHDPNEMLPNFQIWVMVVSHSPLGFVGVFVCRYSSMMLVLPVCCWPHEAFQNFVMEEGSKEARLCTF